MRAQLWYWLKNVTETSASLKGVFVTKAQQHANEPRVYPPPQLNLLELTGEINFSFPITDVIFSNSLTSTEPWFRPVKVSNCSCLGAAL